MKYKRYDALDLILHVLNTDNKFYLSSETRYTLPSLYNTAAKALWRKGDLENSLKTCQKGIKYCLEMYDTKLLDSLYYIESYLLDLFNRKEEAYESAKNAIATCISKKDYRSLKLYNKMFLKEQGYEITIIKK